MKVALTFDDGPNPPYTNQILDILKKENIKATFFVCGANVKRHPNIVKREAREEHIVANHSYNHRYIPTRLGTIYKEIIETQNLIDNLIHPKEKFFRAPWGFTPYWLNKKLKKEGFKIVNFGITGNDWEKYITAEKITQKILSKVHDGAVIVLHDGHNINENADRSKTVAALPIIIKELKNQGYQFTPAII